MSQQIDFLFFLTTTNLKEAARAVNTTGPQPQGCRNSKDPNTNDPNQRLHTLEPFGFKQDAGQCRLLMDEEKKLERQSVIGFVSPQKCRKPKFMAHFGIKAFSSFCLIRYFRHTELQILLRKRKVKKFFLPLLGKFRWALKSWIYIQQVSCQQFKIK